MLKEDNLSHVTAKKWIAFNMEEQYIIKGYKFRQIQDVASLSKLLTFYTAYDIVTGTTDKKQTQSTGRNALNT